ncbi:MAG TPA: RodZ domain-containing protein [Bryobacteraceae bacterium]|nr:RodZ domain-containing protein [Bryobacteraceae bacterium]
MSPVGETLRRERLQKGLSLDQISRETKISTRLLEAIEKDQLDRLPGGVFAKSFVRQYARFLGLDEEELASEVEKQINSNADLPAFAVSQPEPSFKVPPVPAWESTGGRSNSILPALAMVVAVMLVCSAVYVWWQRSNKAAPPPEKVSVVRNSAPPAAAPSAVTKSTEPAPVTPAVSHNPAPPADTEVAQSTPAPTESGTSAAPPAASNPDAKLHVSLTADAEAWVQVWADGKCVIVGTLHPNETRTAEAVDAMRIRTGNAGDLQVSVNGKSAGPLGPKGQIRTLEITPQGVQILAPPPKPAPEPL